MENFIKPFLNKGFGYSSEKVPISVSDDDDSIIKFLQKIIFKHDVVVELKDVLSSVCSAEPFSVDSNVIRNLIERLNALLLSDEDTETKIRIFRLVFLSFVAHCKGDESVRALQFFAVLSHILGMNSLLTVRNGSMSLINEEYFKTAFSVDVPSPSKESFLIFNCLLHCLSKTGSVILSSSEVQTYFKWLQELLKSLALSRPFLSIFMDIFLMSAELDFKLLEGNLRNIFVNILTLEPPLDEDLISAYGVFMERTLIICTKFQRSVSFVTNAENAIHRERSLPSFELMQQLFTKEILQMTEIQSNSFFRLLKSIKAIPVSLDKTLILPSNAANEFLKAVAIASNQHSLSLFDVLLENLEESFNSISQNVSGFETVAYVTTQFLVGFLKEVKLFAPSISSTTLLTLIDKLKTLRRILQDFGSFLFLKKSLKNEDVLRMLLELCFFYGEIETIVNCYKDSILEPSDSDDWQCCITSEQWTKLVNLVLKSKLKTCDSICFQLVLQKIRTRKLTKFLPTEDSTLKLFMHEIDKLDIIHYVPPEDLPILTDELTIEQTKSFARTFLKQTTEMSIEAVSWVTHSAVQENSIFTASLFAEILQHTGSLFQNKNSLCSLTEECFDDENVIRVEVLQRLPEEINLLLKNVKKVRKFVKKNSERLESLASAIKLFKLLPIPHMNDDFRKLGLSFAVGTGILLANDETTASLAFESIYNFVSAETDASTCFDVGLCLKWLSELSYENKNVESMRVMVIESFVRSATKMQLGLEQMGDMIDSLNNLKCASPLKRLESRVVLYNELGKCWQRAKKRKSDNDLIGSYRSKLAKMISLEAKELESNIINSENSKILLKILAIELNKAIKTNEETEIMSLTEEKLPSYFDFAVKTLKKNFNDGAAMFLTTVLQTFAQLRKFLPENSLFKIWKALKNHEKINWRLFCNQTNDEEFRVILTDLLKMSKKFLTSESDKHSSNCFEIWMSFFEFSPNSKRNSCQLHLLEFFNYIHDCGSHLGNLSIRKKIYLIKFFSFCLTKKEVVVTSDVLDTIIHVMLETLDSSCSTEEFHDFFVEEVNVASAILSRQFAWSRSKVHLTYVIFKRLLGALMTKCNAEGQIDKDDIFKLSNCGLSLEKWVSLIIKKEKDFARTTAYFLTSLISSIASFTVIPAIKIHLTNCINNFLSISDSHTVAYLMRVLKPGYQQVFCSLYNQFKKYHKYSGKI